MRMIKNIRRVTIISMVFFILLSPLTKSKGLENDSHESNKVFTYGISLNTIMTTSTGMAFEKNDMLPKLTGTINFLGFNMGIFTEFLISEGNSNPEYLRINLGIDALFGSTEGFVKDIDYKKKVLDGHILNENLLKYNIGNDMQGLSVGISYVNNFYEGIYFSLGIDYQYIKGITVEEEIILNEDFRGMAKFKEYMGQYLELPNCDRINRPRTFVQDINNSQFSLNFDISYYLFSEPGDLYFEEYSMSVQAGYRYFPLDIYGNTGLNASHFKIGLLLQVE